MANEVTGKTLHYWQNSVEQQVKNVQVSRVFDMSQSTTTATIAPGMESTPLRAKSTITIDTDLYTALGSEISTGTLTAGAKYLVTAKGSVLASYSVGQIFTAIGTEAMSATDKVKALGTKITGNTLGLTIGGSTYKLRTINYQKNYTEYEATSSATAAPNKESSAGRAKIVSQITALMYRDTADLIINSSPSALALVLTFASGVTVTGNAIFHQMDVSSAVDGIVEVTYNIEWQGVPVEANLGYLTMATQQAAKVIYEGGTSTNKEVLGNVLLLGMTINADVNGETTIQYSGVFNGAITPAVYS